MTRPALTSLLFLLSSCSVPTIEDPFAPAETFAPTTTATATGGDTLGDSANDDSTGKGSEPATCDSGMLDGDETDVDCGGSCGPCEDGQGCATADDCTSGLCLNQICQPPLCGDGIVQEGEECDEGGATETCTDQCTATGCGDGITTGTEACDDGGESATCNADCTVAACGDGVANATAGEGCDAGGESAECNVDCSAALCGDLMLNATAGEECDEGENTLTCDADCTAVACGDGFANPLALEDCDDGVESAACDADCTAVVCGDGLINVAAGEECEAGPDEACDMSCQFVLCDLDPEAQAMTACLTDYANCVVQNGGVVGYGAGQCTGCNCGPPTNEWRFYCTETLDTNYNCSPCTVGEILGPHEPCNCDPGTSPVLGNFCVP